MKAVLLLAAGLGLVAGVAAAQPALLRGEPGLIRAVGAGALVGIAGSLVGALVVRRHLGADPKRFLSALFGAMLLRLLAFGAAVAAVAVAGEPPLGGFLAGLMSAYVAMQAAEMVSLHRRGAGAG